MYEPLPFTNKQAVQISWLYMNKYVGYLVTKERSSWRDMVPTLLNIYNIRVQPILFDVWLKTLTYG